MDEPPNPSVVRSPLAKVLKIIKGLIESQSLNLLISVTGRPETNIKDILNRSISRYISLHRVDKRGTSVINMRPEKGRWKVEYEQLVIDILTKKLGRDVSVDAEILTTLAHFCDVDPDGYIVG